MRDSGLKIFEEIVIEKPRFDHVIALIQRHGETKRLILIRKSPSNVLNSQINERFEIFEEDIEEVLAAIAKVCSPRKTASSSGSRVIKRQKQS